MREQSSPSSSHGQRFPIVGVGASAGGLGALRQLLEAMPADSGVALVIVQHLAPDKPSLAPELLARYTPMEVEEVTDEPTVQPSRVYVSPPGKFLSIVHGKLQLKQMEGPRSPPIAVDYFFRALAKDQRECAVGVILSGTGSDGALGVKAIKEAGGLVLVQDANTAEYSGMPEQAILSGVVDQVLAPEKIPQALMCYAKHDYICNSSAITEGLDADEANAATVVVQPKKPQHQGSVALNPREATSGRRTGDGSQTSPTDLGTYQATDLHIPLDSGSASASAGLAAIIELLRSSGNRDFRDYKEATLLRRTHRRMCLQHIDTLDEYLVFLKENPAEIETLANDLLISVTDFFRDPLAWEELSRVVIPEIVKNKSYEEAVRVWVAGCATGEEAYTVAMLIQEEISKQKKSCALQIFASDIDKRALDEARAGRYPVSIVADISPDRIARFFNLKDGELHYQVNKSLRETVVFAEQNLLSDPPFSHLDLILCRNVMIYLNPQMQQKLIALFHFALRPQGYLMLGTAENVGRREDLFQTLSKRWRIYQGIVASPRDRVDVPIVSGTTQRAGAIASSPARRREESVSQLAQQILIDMLAARAILIDRHGRMVYITGDVNSYILHKPGVPNDDLIDKAREGLRSKLRGAVHKAFAEKSCVSFQCRLTNAPNAPLVRVQVRYVSDTKQGEAFALVVFQDDPNSTSRVSPPDDRSRGGGGDLTELSEADVSDKSIIAQLEEELAVTKEELQSTLEQFEASHEEFKASNEEVMSVNEELQSTNEELETSKEELQSLNEELSTVNLQLGAKVAELEVKHADLENLISATEVATVCLGEDLSIRWFTPAAQRWIRFQPSDIGRPLQHFQHDFATGNLLEECQQVLEQKTPIEQEVDCVDSRSLIRRIVPYRTDDHRTGGVVITMLDITSRRQRELKLQASEERFRELSKNLESQVQERTELMEILQHVTRIANEAVSVDGALYDSLTKIIEYNGWCVGHVWLQSEESSGNEPQMVSSGIWYISRGNSLSQETQISSQANSRPPGPAETAPNVPTRHSPFAQFQTLTAQARFSRGEGLIGRVMQSGQPEWIDDIDKHPDLFRRAVVNLELHAAIAFPITIAGEVVAVMECLSREVFPPQERFLEIVPDIGIQLGHVISRKRLQTLVAEIAEAEQHRIGRELHDRIAQQLTGGALIAHSLKQSLPEELTAEIESANHLIEILDQAHEDVRTLSAGLMPEPISAADLIPALRGLAAQTTERFQVRCEVDDGEFDESLMANDATANLIFLIVREAIHNVVKHANAENVKITVRFDKSFQLTVRDNGQGFDSDRHPTKSHGLQIMRYRAESVGGNLKVESALQGGTQVILTIPQKSC